jgi:TolB protein
MPYRYLLKLYNIVKLSLALILLNLLYLNNSMAIGNITISGSNKESLPIQLKIDTFDQTTNLNLLHVIIGRVQQQLNDSLIFKVNREEDNNKLISRLLNKAPKIIAYEVSFAIKYQDNSDKVIISLGIFDNILNKKINQFEVTTTAKEWFDGAAEISDRLYYHFTGVYGYFDTSIVFVSEKGRFDNRTKKIAYMSLYGDRYEEYTNGTHLVLSPTISREKTDVAYVSYRSGKPKTFLYNIKTKQVTKAVASKQDIMTLTPNFVREQNNLLLLSTVYEGNSEVTLYNTQTKKAQRLTDNPATDISADFSISQNKIVFSSDRSGKAELYLIDSNGHNLKRLKFSKGTYTTPKFSPDGRYIAFTRILNNQFSIGILDTDTFFTKILTTSYKNDSPSWAPNSKYIMFTQVQEKHRSQKKNLSNLFIVDLNGNIIKKVNTPFDASEAYWFKNEE